MEKRQEQQGAATLCLYSWRPGLLVAALDKEEWSHHHQAAAFSAASRLSIGGFDTTQYAGGGSMCHVMPATARTDYLNGLTKKD